MGMLERSKIQPLLARNAEVADLKVQLVVTQMKVANAEYERDGDRARFQQLQSGH